MANKSDCMHFTASIVSSICRCSVYGYIGLYEMARGKLINRRVSLITGIFYTPNYKKPSQADLGLIINRLLTIVNPLTVDYYIVYKYVLAVHAHH